MSMNSQNLFGSSGSRTLDLKTERTCTAWAVIGSLESIKDRLGSRELVVNQPLPVVGIDNKNLIGYGSLKVESTQVYADISILYNTAERLVLDAADEDLYIDIAFTADISDRIWWASSLTILPCHLRPNDPMAAPIRIRGS